VCKPAASIARTRNPNLVVFRRTTKIAGLAIRQLELACLEAWDGLTLITGPLLLAPKNCLKQAEQTAAFSEGVVSAEQITFAFSFALVYPSPVFLSSIRGGLRCSRSIRLLLYFP
jgi:hypothetical protein